MKASMVLLLATLASALCSPNTRPEPEPQPQPQPQPGDSRIRELPPRQLIADDPVLTPTKPTQPVPPSAMAEREPGGSFAAASSTRWQQSTVSLGASSDTAVSVTGPAVVLVKATWHGSVQAARLSILKDGAQLAAATASSAPPDLGIATARVQVAAAGNLVVRLTGSASKSLPVDLVIGVVPQTSSK